MMKHYLFILTILLLGSRPCLAQLFDAETAKAVAALKKQQPYTGERYSPGRSLAGSCILSKSTTVDTCRLEITYTAEIILDSLSPKKTTDLIVVQVGDSVLKYYSWVWWRQNMNHTLFQAGKENEQISGDESYKMAVDYTIFRDVKQGRLLNCHVLQRLNNLIYEYEEPLPRFEWTITEDTLTVAGYPCYKALARHAGRDWTVWFTPQIPIDGGLWKFNGLPGLVLKACDAQNYFLFTLRSINPNTDPIVYYEIPKKAVTRKEYRKLEMKRFRSPFHTNLVDGIIVPNPVSNQMEFLPDDWQIPYNPIERE